MIGNPPSDVRALCSRHLQVAWWSLACFVALGIVLEGLHAFKFGWYLGPGAETRRLLWTLAHSHGTLLALVHVAFAATCYALAPRVTARHRLASVLLTAAGVLLPVGFFLGGVFPYDGDPGLGIWLVPVGAGCLLLSVLLTACEVVCRAALPAGSGHPEPEGGGGAAGGEAKPAR